jgi:hypothetical protein
MRSSGEVLYPEVNSYGRVSPRVMVVYEGTKKVLVIANHIMLGVIRQPDCIHFGFGRGTVHIYFVLAFLGFGAVFPSECDCSRGRTC